MFQISLTLAALEDLQGFRAYEQRQIIQAIEEQLQYQPTLLTRNRKRLRPNTLAEWELRIDAFRVFYDVDKALPIVKIAAIGYKQGNILFVHGQEYEL
ncbi:type II toxin-antitoxin system RelE/ParE family toxin [Phormidium tenue FACHB-886]|nr:type II toxin-antitoxin system RelE/ParE family toxin [Phormidium tenue FACHB-886]